MDTEFNDVTAPYPYANHILYVCLPFSHTVLYLNKTHLKRFRQYSMYVRRKMTASELSLLCET